MDDEKVAKVAKEYVCICCNYKCFRKNDYDKHLATAKHKKMEISKNMINLDDEKVAKVAKVANEEFVCICGKSYKYRQGLFKHQQKCNTKEPVCGETQKTGVSDELVCQLVKDNTEMKKLFGDLVNVVKEKDKKIEEKDKKK